MRRPLRLAAELVLLAASVAGVVTVTGWTLDRIASGGHGHAAAPGPAVAAGPAVSPASGPERIVRMNGVLMERAVLPLESGTTARDVERLVRGSPWWRSPLFADDPDARGLDGGSLEVPASALVRLESSAGAQRYRSAQVLQAGGRSWLVLLRSVEDVVRTQDGEPHCRLDAAAGLDGLRLPDGWRPMLSLEAPGGEEGLHCFLGGAGGRAASDWPAELVRQGWEPVEEFSGRDAETGAVLRRAGATWRVRWSDDPRNGPWCAIERSGAVSAPAGKRG